MSTRPGKRDPVVFETEAKAERYIELLRVNLNQEEQTTKTALETYKSFLKEKGNKEESIDVTEGAMELFFPSPVPMQLLSAKRCEALYADLRTRPAKRTKQAALSRYPPQRPRADQEFSRLVRRARLASHQSIAPA